MTRIVAYSLRVAFDSFDTIRIFNKICLLASSRPGASSVPLNRE